MPIPYKPRGSSVHAIHSGNNVSKTRKVFCVNEGRLMLFDSIKRRFFCPECQYSPELENTKFKENMLVTPDGYTAAGTQINTARKFRPIKQGAKRRAIDKKAPEFKYDGYDKDLQKLIAQGYNIKETSEEVNEIGIEYLGDKDKR